MNLFAGNQKLNAFTLLELLVGMIVSGIVIGSIFSAYHIISRQVVRYERSAESIAELSILHSTLLRDIELSDSIDLVDGNTFICYGKQQMRYTFFDHGIIRIGNDHSDTLIRGASSYQYIDGEVMTAVNVSGQNIQMQFHDRHFCSKTGEPTE